MAGGWGLRLESSLLWEEIGSNDGKHGRKCFLDPRPLISKNLNELCFLRTCVWL
jgi:hypothetical protein